MPTRRGFLAGAAALGAAPAWADAGDPKFLAAARNTKGAFELHGLNAVGYSVFRLPLPARGHAAAAQPFRAEAVAFARRPGRFGLVIDCARGGIIRRLDAPGGRHFSGHGAFSRDGAMLVTTENDFDAGRGVLGLWAVDENYRRIGEIASGGIGPHEIIRTLDGGFAVANGGILTHPSSGREKLNLATMRPNLTMFGQDLLQKDVLELEAALHQNSIRHIAAAPDGAIAIGMQWEGDLYEAPSLIAVAHDGRIDAMDVGETIGIRLNGYIGSVAFDRKGETIAATAPRGDRLITLNRKGQGSSASVIKDVSGVAAARVGFLSTSGTGNVRLSASDSDQQDRSADVQWDNHLVPIGEV
ncbi:MAG: DUF1513 domain-containing protein [Pseudomonadota bacterium]